MASKKLYNDYFNIAPKYFPQVTKELINEGKVSWKNYFANDSFLQTLTQTCDMVNGQKSLSMFTWGPYGSGKSHLLLTLISMLKADDSEIEEYFTDQNLSKDLMNKFIAMKNSGKIITIHRIGSAGIETETDLIIAVQQSIMNALEQNGITNQGAAAMKDSFLKYISDPDNRDYFEKKTKNEQYIFDFSGKSIDEIENTVKSTDDSTSEEMMRKVMKVMKDIGQIGILKDSDSMSNWIKDIIDKNNIKAIIFAWDEFSEFLINHPNGLTGFQNLLEISNSHPFYFIIVAHEAERIFNDNKAAKKFLDRFQKPVEISLPENTALKLLGSAMKITDDPVMSDEWNTKIKPTINGDLAPVRQHILSFERTAGKKKSVFTDEDLQSVAPIHPYAALVLRQIASMFNSNQRSMFDFVISDDDEFQGFKWFIRNHSPFNDKLNILTIDMLWEYFCGKQVTGLSNDVKGIFLSYDGLKSENLLPEEQRVLKTILILQAISTRISNDALLAPSEETLDLAFSGTGWSKGKAKAIADGLKEKGLIFEKPIANGHKEYIVANGNVGNDDIKKYREQAVAETKTTGLITNAKLSEAVTIPASVEMRYQVETACEGSFMTALNNHYKRTNKERINVVITFAMNDIEAAKVKEQIIKSLNAQNNEIMFIETLVPMGKDLYDQYIDSLTYSKYFQQKDKEQARHYQNQAEGVLRQWNQNIANGAFMLYSPENKNGERKANLTDLQKALREYDAKKYSRGLEQYTLNATLYSAYNIAQGAELGIVQETKGAYKISNPKNSIENALEGAWNVEKYWEDSTKQSLTIVQVKKKIEEMISESFDKNGEVSILSIWEEMEKPPFGFMPTAITSYVLGFCLKEYAKSDYFWSNHSKTETMTADKMKQLVANVINYRLTNSKNYKEEFIVTMTPQKRQFLKGSSAIFGIPEAQCTSIEGTRDQIRIKMRGYQFPIWCVKYLLKDWSFKSSREDVEKAIDYYTSIANTANTSEETENSLAEKLGQLFIDKCAVIDDLKKMINDNNCREGMVAYVGVYNGGALRQLAAEIKDNGQYIDEVKKKFNAGDGNWVWNSQTANERIDDVILEYKIIKESNKSLSACHSLSETISEWNRRTNNIKMPCEAVAKQVGDLGQLLDQLSSIKRNNGISEQNKQKFYDLLCTQREAFDVFYKNQVPYFKADANSLLSDLSDTDIDEIYTKLPSGQFTKGKTEYYNFVQQEIDSYIQSQWKKKMQALWLEKTNSKDPVDWSEKYNTPILCMVPEKERAVARNMFDIIKAANPSEEEAKAAIDFMEKAEFYDRLDDEAERDKRFMEMIVGVNAVLLDNVKDIRAKLRAKISHDSPYYWLENTAVQSCLKSMADKEYKLNGSERASQIIDGMNAAQLREYLKQRIADDTEFGIQILKGEGKK